MEQANPADPCWVDPLVLSPQVSHASVIWLTAG